MQQKANLFDDYMDESSNTTHFYMVTDIDLAINRYQESNGVLVSYIFQASNMNTVYQRSIFNLFDALSRLGGVYSAMFTGGYMFTAAFSYKLLMSSLIGKLFHFRPRLKKKMKKKKKKKKKEVKKIYVTKEGSIKKNFGSDKDNKDPGE